MKNNWHVSFNWSQVIFIDAQAFVSNISGHGHNFLQQAFVNVDEQAWWNKLMVALVNGLAFLDTQQNVDFVNASACSQ